MMADGRRRDEYDRSAPIALILANSNRDPKKTQAFKMKDFHPFAEDQQVRVMKVSLMEAIGDMGKKRKKVPNV